LPGQQYSVLPMQPPAGMGPLPFKGYLASITLRSDSIRIDRKLMGRLNGNRSAVVLWHQLVGVDFRDPTRIVNGHVHFATAADPRGLTGTGRGRRMAAAARNPHAIMFTWQQRAAYEQLRDLLIANPAVPASGPRSAPADNDHSPGPQQFVADELAKLHGLYRQGAVTLQEYEHAKPRLLGYTN
jgi:hypothetical protein